MKARIAASIDFLKWFRVNGPWVLTAIVPDGRITTTTFRENQIKHMEDWLTGRAGRENIYFQVNSTSDRNITKKTSKSDIFAVEWLHVDVDPKTDLFVAERKRILQKLTDFSPQPSIILDSGGGYQAFWRLVEPVHSDWTEVERYNRQLEAELGGDHCYNVDRIMRLPGTINLPTKRKRKKGRKPALARVVHKSNDSFDLNMFSRAPLLDGGEQGDVGRPAVQLSGNLPPLSEVDELDEYGNVSQHIKMLIVQGLDPEEPDKYPSRSECFWYVVCELARCKIPDDIIASVILDPDFLISGHVLDQKNPQGYAVRQIQRAKEHAINKELPAFNDTHFVTFVGGRIKVVKEMFQSDKGRVLKYIDPASFEKYYANKQVVIGKTKEGDPVKKKLGRWWMEHSVRRSYQGLVFDPSGETLPNHYNLWRGFAVSAVTGNLHEKFLAHLLDNICSGNKEHYDYLIRWCARLVQTPATQSETAIVLRGKEGTGKNSFVETLRDLFPEHYYEASRPEHIAGNFNRHLQDKILIHANEAFFAAERKYEAPLKGMITDPTLSIESKGVDLTQQTNYLHLVMSSNSDWVVPAGPESRRFFVLDVGEERMQDSSYFAPMKKDLAAGGLSHFLRFLLDIDLSGWNIRKFPTTKALIEQRIHTMSKEGQWWMARLDRGYIIDAERGWRTDIPVESVYKSYAQDMQEQAESYRKSKIELGQFLSKVCPGLEKRRIRRGSSRSHYYILPRLDECKAAFDRIMGGPFPWTDLTVEVEEDFPF